MKRKEVVRPTIDHVDLIGQHGDELTAFEIMQQTGLSKNTVFKLQRMIKDAQASKLEIPVESNAKTRALYEYVKIQYDPACRVKPEPQDRYIAAPEQWQKDFKKGMEELTCLMVLRALKEMNTTLDKLLQPLEDLFKSNTTPRIRGNQISIDDL